MDTSEALRKAMQAVKDAGIPEDLWPTALPLALADLRGNIGAPGAGVARTEISSGKSPGGKSTSRGASSQNRVAQNGHEPSTFAVAASSPDFLDRIARQTGTNLDDLRDVFHIEGDALDLKVPSKGLGATDKAKTKTLTALMAGAVFAGTDIQSIPFSEIHQVCKAMRCFSSKHAAEYVRETDGFGAVGSGRSAALTHKNGWEAAFAAAVDRVLGKAKDNA